MSAGILCFSNTHVLAGVQKYKKRQIGGFGGKCENVDVDFRDTAIREFLEELFNIRATPTLAACIDPFLTIPTYVASHDYAIFFITLTDLELILDNLTYAGAKSPYYPEGFPRTISQLISERSMKVNGEISRVLLLSRQEIVSNKIRNISIYFRDDLRLIK